MIHVHRFESGAIEVQISSTSANAFKELVHRATNLWPDASPEIKQFADMICNDGKLMQDYRKATVTNQPKQVGVSKEPQYIVCLCERAGNVSHGYMRDDCTISCPKHP